MATVKLTVKLLGGTVTLNADGKRLLNAEVEARTAWYDTHTGGIPRKPYTAEQRSALSALEKAKAAFVGHVGAPDYKAAVKLVGYSPQYSPRVRRG